MTCVFFLAEIVTGYVGNSIALVSDAFNMLSDIISLSVGLVAARVRRRASSPRCTYGLVRVEVLGALANAVFLAAVRFSVSAQALERLAEPEGIDKPDIVLIVGSIGLCINVIGLLVFQDWRCLRKKAALTPHRDSARRGDTDTEAGGDSTSCDALDNTEFTMSQRFALQYFFAYTEPYIFEYTRSLRYSGPIPIDKMPMSPPCIIS